MKSSKCSILTGFFGNFLEHYDYALFSLLAPFLAPLFFDQKDPIVSLILTYAMLPLGFLSRFVGSLFFGWLGDHLGRKRALCSSLTGLSITTVLMGFLPTYAQVGMMAPLGLLLARLLQGFFAAGETIGGAIFVLEQTENRKKNWMSSLYDASSVLGMLTASFMLFLYSHSAQEIYWRYLFWAGALTAIVALILRMASKEEIKPKIRKEKKFNVFLQYKRVFVTIALVAGFSSSIYCLAFTLASGYIPLVNSITKNQIVKINTYLLCFDMCILPLFGYLATKIGREKQMLIGALGTALIAIPCFYCFSSSSILIVSIGRVLLVIAGVVFSATYHVWAQDLVKQEHRYRILCTAHAVGSQVIGTSTAFISLWLYKASGWIAAPALYVICIALLAAWAVFTSMHTHKKREVQRLISYTAFDTT
ncbi:Proline/betaine transporter [Candidatus Rhabdochlamydia oedothoracis]|uniref:Proline/betaine transporter n=1 Tax=Candidatus Rhabdochlamydia oedothoracis TaxID=2720720 RepID=A0ABX8UZS0_9BACT|nr:MULTISPECIES: MFS transporter [Rhabdochlamydia]KAG6559228.1 Proline/betaine transporter [Candidatus Rhabdochlamydia sp. W815]MCL6755829.1 MFS transporter [Candidatus Rhabdochlamydia oedothoracis]QYF48121.1 Proline/betaine transporter [Candidatus Rhabdochlamydia oedothoracis]